MAFHIRRVKVKALNDSKEIAVIIYINSIILAVLTYHDVYAAMFGIGLLVDATLFKRLIFIAKVRIISSNLVPFSKQNSN